MSTTRGWIIVGALAVLAAGPARAFGTIHGLGQNAEHERITRQGLASFGIGARTMDQIAGRRGTFGAVGAPDRPDRGLMSESAAHCDNGDWLDLPAYPRGQAEARTELESCRAWIFGYLERAVSEADGLVTADMTISGDAAGLKCSFDGRDRRSKCSVLEQLGMAFHASQDFYSHSNWVDPLRRPGQRLDDPPGMGQPSPADWLDPDYPDAAFPGGLISGCYEGFPESRHCDGRVKHATLNKDTKASSRGANGIQQLAMDVASQDTRAKWTWFEQRLVRVYGADRGGRIACVIKADDPARCAR